MRVLHVITDLNTGGAEKLMTELLPRLSQDAIDVELCLFNGQDTPFLQKLAKSGIKIHNFGLTPDYYNPKHIRSLIKLAKGFDIVHTHNTPPQLFGAIAGLFTKARWITTEHTTSSHRRVWWFRHIERWMYHRYKHIICVSDAVADTVKELSGKKDNSISVVTNGIDFDQFTNATPLSKDSIGRPELSKTILLMVGRLSYQKDQATIIKALSLLPDNVELWLAGDGETKSELKTLATNLGIDDRVQFLGLRSDVPQLLKTADIVVHSSHIEAFGLAAVEAMAAGTPVIASDIPGLGEIVKDAGILFKHGDAEDLANRVRGLVAEPVLKDKLKARGYNVAASYSIDRMAKNYRECYGSLLD